MPCTVVPPVLLVGTLCLYPSDVSATPLLRQPQAKEGWSSSSRPVRRSHHNRCRVVARSPSLLTGLVSVDSAVSVVLDLVHPPASDRLYTLWGVNQVLGFILR